MRAGFADSTIRRVHTWGLLLGLCLASFAPGSFAAKAQDTAPEPRTESFYLEYQESNFVVQNCGLTVTPGAAAFRREPDFGRHKIFRGSFSFGGESALAFAWDPARGKVYLDLNRNGDLTDDSGGMFECSTPIVSRLFQTFPGIRVERMTREGRKPVLLDLTLHEFNGQLGTSVGLRSFWQGKASFLGRDWQLGIIENLNPTLGTNVSRFLLMRPWVRKDEIFGVMDGSMAAFNFAPDLFLEGRAYHLDCRFQLQGGKTACVLRLKEQQAKLGELRFSGKSVQRLLLTGPGYTVLVDSPGPLARVPIGDYSQEQIWLKEGSLEATWDLGYIQPGLSHSVRPVTVSESKTAIVSAGGPLTNTVTVQQQGRHLVLQYRLVGADGNTYRLLRNDPIKPPRFAISRDGKEIAAGQFEFG